MIAYSLKDEKITKVVEVLDESNLIKIIDGNEFTSVDYLPEAITEWYEHELKHSPICKADFEGEYLFGLFAIPHKTNLFAAKRKCYFIFNKNELILISDSYETQAFMDKLSAQRHGFSSISDIFLSMLEKLVYDDLFFLYSMEEKLEKLEEQVIGGKETGINEALLHFKKQLIILHGYYEQLVAIGDRIEGEDFFDKVNHRQLHSFQDRVERLDNKVDALREYCSQIRESFHSQTDIKMNKIMQTLTVITTLFMPVTVVSAWYGMNFVNMPELTSPYGYIITVAATVLLTVSAILFCKHKKIL